VRTLNDMFVKAANDPELTELFTRLGVEIATGTPDDFKKAVASVNAARAIVKELTRKTN
jgi:hypothetical protein